jgi:hypothetical protein
MAMSIARAFLLGLVVGALAVASFAWARHRHAWFATRAAPPAPICTTAPFSRPVPPRHPEALIGSWRDVVALGVLDLGANELALDRTGDLMVSDWRARHRGYWDADDQFLTLRTSAGDTRYRYLVTDGKLHLENPCEVRRLVRF